MTAKVPPDPARRFRRPEHRAIITALRSMNVPLLRRCRCWFGGGTAIVLAIGEYRLSKDMNFRCADVDGYRQVRSPRQLRRQPRKCPTLVAPPLFLR